jgi:hypothetical protein
MVAVDEQPEPIKATANKLAIAMIIFPFNSRTSCLGVLNCITSSGILHKNGAARKFFRHL